MNNYKETKELCQTFSKGFEGIEQLIGMGKKQKPAEETLERDSGDRQERELS
jgi:hypothetical protein